MSDKLWGILGKVSLSATLIYIIFFNLGLNKTVIKICGIILIVNALAAVISMGLELIKEKLEINEKEFPDPEEIEKEMNKKELEEMK